MRRGAVEALGRFGPDTFAAIPQLRSLQSDSHDYVRDAARKALAALEAPSQPDAGVDQADSQPR
jgi:hypothetical protein